MCSRRWEWRPGRPRSSATEVGRALLTSFPRSRAGSKVPPCQSPAQRRPQEPLLKQAQVHTDTPFHRRYPPTPTRPQNENDGRGPQAYCPSSSALALAQSGHTSTLPAATSLSMSPLSMPVPDTGICCPQNVVSTPLLVDFIRCFIGQPPFFVVFPKLGSVDISLLRVIPGK